MLLKLGDPLVGRLLSYCRRAEQSFRTFKVRRDPECPASWCEGAGEIVIAEHDDTCMPHAHAQLRRVGSGRVWSATGRRTAYV